MCLYNDVIWPSQWLLTSQWFCGHTQWFMYPCNDAVCFHRCVSLHGIFVPSTMTFSGVHDNLVCSHMISVSLGWLYPHSDSVSSHWLCDLYTLWPKIMTFAVFIIVCFSPQWLFDPHNNYYTFIISLGELHNDFFLTFTITLYELTMTSCVLIIHSVPS